MRALATAAAAFLVSMPFVPASIAFHAETCSAAGAAPLEDVAGLVPFYATVTPQNGWGGGGPGSHGPGYNPVKFTLTLSPGEHYVLALQLLGDVDVAICVPGALQNRHACATGQIILFPEQCMIAIAGAPGCCPPIRCFGPLACDYVMYVFYCSGVECGYPVQPPYAAIAGVII